jgi:hypothetical protein
LFFIIKGSQWKIFFSQKKILFDFQESVFFYILDGKHFPEVVKVFEMSCYVLIISNLVLELLITIYFILIFFSISSLRIWFYLIFISTLVLIFIIVICFYLIIFLIEIFYLSDLVLILFIITYFIWNNLWNYNFFF